MEQELQNQKYEIQALEQAKETLSFEVSSIQNSYNKALIELQSRDMNRLDNDQEIKILRQKTENGEAVLTTLNAKNDESSLLLLPLHHKFLSSSLISLHKRKIILWKPPAPKPGTLKPTPPTVAS